MSCPWRIPEYAAIRSNFRAVVLFCSIPSIQNAAATNNPVMIGVIVRPPSLVWIPYELLSPGEELAYETELLPRSDL
jgi:hypothetical protein